MEHARLDEVRALQVTSEEVEQQNRSESRSLDLTSGVTGMPVAVCAHGDRLDFGGVLLRQIPKMSICRKIIREFEPRLSFGAEFAPPVHLYRRARCLPTCDEKSDCSACRRGILQRPRELNVYRNPRTIFKYFFRQSLVRLVAKVRARIARKPYLVSPC